MAEVVTRTNGIINDVTIYGAATGALAGNTFVAKDTLDVEGHTTSAGNPDWLKTHSPASMTAPVIKLILDAGASLVGKSLPDELAFSIDGINVHYGIPVNGQYEDRIPGGSSSGSASAVSRRLVDFALGTDTGGSVRVPASYCGIFGMRPSHGSMPMQGVVPLAPSFDTVGWLARSSQLLKNIGEVLLQESCIGVPISKILVAKDLFNMTDSSLKAALERGLSAIKSSDLAVEEVELDRMGFQEFLNTFTVMQGWEAWQCHGEWINAIKPHVADDIRKRLEFCSTVSQDQYNEAVSFRNHIIDEFARLLGENGVLCMPTTRDVPPLVTASPEQMQANRRQTMSLTTIASLAKLPQISIPIRVTETTTTGLSFLAAWGKDMLLLDFAVQCEKQYP